MGTPETHLGAAEAEPLQWGYRYLMCRPDYFDVTYEINPWMDVDRRPDAELAIEQWERLVAAFEAAGAKVELLPPVAGLPDLVFTANAGLVDGERVFVSRFRYPERRPESAHDEAWFRAAGFKVVEVADPSPRFEAGDAIPFGDSLIAAHGFRTEAATYDWIAPLVGSTVVSAPLIDRQLYHLDVAFCPLDSRHALVARPAFDRWTLAAIGAVVPEPLYIDADEAATFCANSAVIGSTVIMPACPPRIARVLEGWGFEVVVVDVGEFLKAGGAVSCLALALDTRLDRRS
jgi:N-dimethylarginine dimethylaminohydrolase